MNAYSVRRISRIDACFALSLVFVSLLLTINVLLQSVHLAYIVILLALSVIIYVTKKHDDERNSLKDLWTLGGLSVFLYPIVDYFFEAKLKWVSYVTNDPKILVTPLYVILYWVFGVLLFGYCYLRIKGLTNDRWMSGFATGLFAAASATFMENLFNAMGFYRNTPSSFMIGHVPVFIPIGYVASFSFFPIYLRRKFVSGFLLYGITGFSWYLSYHISALLGVK